MFIAACPNNFILYTTTLSIRIVTKPLTIPMLTFFAAPTGDVKPPDTVIARIARVPTVSKVLTFFQPCPTAVFRLLTCVDRFFSVSFGCKRRYIPPHYIRRPHVHFSMLSFRMFCLPRRSSWCNTLLQLAVMFRVLKFQKLSNCQVSAHPFSLTTVPSILRPHLHHTYTTHIPFATFFLTTTADQQ